MAGKRTGRALMGLLLLCSAAVFAQQAPAGTPSDIQQLRQTLLDQLRRLDALERKGAPVDFREVDALRAILSKTDQRIAALEATSGVSPSAPSREQGEVSLPSENVPAAPASAEVSPAVSGKKAWDSPIVPSFYGILKPRWGFSDRGQSEVGDSSSRLGLQMSYPFAGRFTTFAKIELGLNLASQNTVYISGGQHGPPQGKGKDPVYTRQGYGGLTTPWGSLSVGKQYSAYYDVAGWTDQFMTFGGEASGAFGVADGGVAGTGRASQAVVYRLDKAWFHLAFQSQHRNIESHNSQWFCTAGGSARFDLGPTWSVGAAYNEVRDGVDKPEGIQAKSGDKAFIAGVKFTRGPWYGALDFADTRQHQKDDRGVWFDGHGAELAVRYTFNERWAILGGYNYLVPVGGYRGRFQTSYALLTATYAFHENMVFSGEFRFDDGRTAGGVRSFPTVFALGLDFGW